MKLKICGIKNVNDAIDCIGSNVDYIGLNFCRKSKRYVKNGNLIPNLNLIDFKNTKIVAVFMDNSPDEIDSILMQYPEFHALQFHSMDLVKIQYLRRQYQIWQVIPADLQIDETIKCNSGLCDAFLFDNKHPGLGIPFNPGILNLKNMKQSYGIAGGINENNIADFKIKYPEAKFLDLASGVEEDGKFSAQKLENIVSAFYGS